MSDKLDINAIKSRQDTLAKGNYDVFNGSRTFKRDNRPKQEKSVEEKNLDKKMKANEKTQFDQFMSRRLKKSCGVTVNPNLLRKSVA